MKNLILACVGLLAPFAVIGQGKITLRPDMITNLSTKGDATLLIDEQALVGDPKNSTTSATPSTAFSGGYNYMYFPLQVVIDLKANHSLSEIYLFDYYNKDSIKIFTGTPFNWTLSSTVWLGGWSNWRSVSLNTDSRYIMLEFPSNKAQVAEIVLYGTPKETPAQIPARVAHTLPTMENLIGLNALHNQPLNKLKCAGSIREYHPWQWDEGNGKAIYPGYPNNEFAWAPSWVSANGWGWDFDETYEQFLNAGFDLSPCLQRTAPFMLDSTGNNEHKPISPNDDAADPQSYEEHARYLYQFTARYGSTTVPASKLMLRSTQTAKSGLDLVKYIENWNEPDKWWRGRKGYFTPFEMAAMCSADYDGHEGAMGDGYGAKAADPNIKFVMGGLTILGLDYIKSMKLWSDFNRTTGFPADVLNFHHYSNISGGQDVAMKQAISPEEDNLKAKLKEVVEYRDRYLPGREIWVSEFGYDTNPNSPQGTTPIGQNSEYEVQAQWLIRSYLEMAAAGIDKAHIYFFADLNAQNPNKFNSSGLVNEKWNQYQPKTSWYYVFAMKKALTGYKFDSEIPSGDSTVNIYKFHNPLTSTSIYAAWCNTSEDKKISNFPIPLNGALGATLLELNHGDTIAQESYLSINAKQQVLVNLSERPVFIRAISTNSTSCVDINAQNSVTVFLDQNGQASISPEDVDNGSKANCGPLNLSISKNTFDCSEVSSGYYVEINSDTSWRESSIADQTTHMSFPWSGVSGNLPPTSSFSIPVTLGQPKSWHSVDSTGNSRVIKCDRFVTFYRKTFQLQNPSSASFFAEMTVDDDMEIYLNGNLIAREESHDSKSSKLPAHRLESDSPLLPSFGESFDFVDPNPEQYLLQGENEVILAVRNKNKNDNGGFSFRMGIGNPSAAGTKVLLTATDSITKAQDTASTIVNVVDILPPTFNLQLQPAIYFDNNGQASFSLADMAYSIADNCQVQAINYSPSQTSYTALQDTSVLEVVSDSTWVKSSFVNSQDAFSFPWQGSSKLPDSTTYNSAVTTAEGLTYLGIHQIDGTEIIKTDAHITFFKKSFDLNLASIDECWIELTVDDDAEIYLNGQLIAREGSFSVSNSSAPAHSIYFNQSSIVNGYKGGDSFDYISSVNLASAINLNGHNEIVLAIRNGGNNNIGGFSFKLSIPVTEKNHIPAQLVATDKFGNINSAYTTVELIDTIPPTIVASSPLLIPDSAGILHLNASQFNTGSYDNIALKSISIFPTSVSCANAQAATLTAIDIFGNTSTKTIPLSVVTSNCPQSEKKSASAGGNNEDNLNTEWHTIAYPLPANSQLTVSMVNTIPGKEINVEIWDVRGKLMFKKNTSAYFDNWTDDLDISDLAAGQYFLKTSHGDDQQTMKFTVN